MINITLPDNSVRQFDDGVTPMDVAKSISEGLARNVISSQVNGESWDTTRPIDNDASLRLFTWKDDEGKAAFWHPSGESRCESRQQASGLCRRACREPVGRAGRSGRQGIR